MVEHRYTWSQFDHCINLCKLHDGSFIYLLLYVDNMLIASKSKVEIDKLKAQLSKTFEMIINKTLSMDIKKILSVEIKRDKTRCAVWLS